MFNLTGRTALMTGGARGLGLAMARALGAHGARIMLMDRDGATLHAGVEALRADGIEAFSSLGDVTVPADSARAVSAMQELWGHVDIGVCNAGIAGNRAAEDVSLEFWNALIGVNLTGVFFTAQACARAMIEQRAGSIIAIASMSGMIVNVPQKQAVYNITKAGVIMAVRSLASEWAEFGIRVNAIAPGYMRTDMTAPYFADPALSSVWLGATPMNRPGEPAELGGAIVYLASDASSFTTGHTLVVDGGYTIR
jgi:NAD(P)-dependent dehydrogenase (short-subunit alcohol dehydrogenase family)